MMGWYRKRETAKNHYYIEMQSFYVFPCAYRTQYVITTTSFSSYIHGQHLSPYPCYITRHRIRRVRLTYYSLIDLCGQNERVETLQGTASRPKERPWIWSGEYIAMVTIQYNNMFVYFSTAANSRLTPGLGILEGVITVPLQPQRLPVSGRKLVRSSCPRS